MISTHMYLEEKKDNDCNCDNFLDQEQINFKARHMSQFTPECHLV